MMNESVKRFWLIAVLILTGIAGNTQKVYFVDGFHGGIYGHYPAGYTAFINEMLAKHPEWVISLEIEPETWDSVRLNEPANYATFRDYLADQSDQGRVEYVNPSYGQAYLYNIHGESIIRQFSYGIRKMKSHFPGLVYSSYSSEEPCFTSALPQILSSFGFKYASLKNPNTCWGGYTRAHGGELLNWVGPDGTKLLTVPRYASEALDPNSTWQTTASTNSKAFISSALDAGIKNPVGMCLQDAGWKFGPWLKKNTGPDKSTYITWRNYIGNVAGRQKLADWKFSQEDVQVSLVWGAQVLQQIARQVRVSENKIVRSEKLASMASVLQGSSYPAAAFDEAWRGLMLAQHHDCWIVPYNGKRNNTWIDKVQRWTDTANRLVDSSSALAWSVLNGQTGNGVVIAEQSDAGARWFVRVYNSNAGKYTGITTVDLPNALNGKNLSLISSTGKVVPHQLDGNRVSFMADVPGTGISTYSIREQISATENTSMVSRTISGGVKLETDLYQLVFDPAKGGALVSLVAKKMNNKQFIQPSATAGMNSMSGYFFRDSSILSTAAQIATITTVSDGPLLASIRIDGFIGKHPFSQLVTVTKSGDLIDVDLNINWVGNPGIGDSYKQSGGYKAEDYRKAFYDDSKKLQTLFPLALEGQKIHKNAPFDVTESRLATTFFQTWDSIKNNIILNWVDVTDAKGQYGFALFTDHTTNYSHDGGSTLGLTTQYSGVGLWGRNYSITGPTRLHYAFFPHKGGWEQAAVWQKNSYWNNPPEAALVNGSNVPAAQQLVSLDNDRLEITAIEMQGDDLIVRLFNPSTKPSAANIRLPVKSAKTISAVELDGRVKSRFKTVQSASGTSVNLQIKPFGIQTIRISGIKKLST
ncbi:MAG: glycosyl hydrolase [Chitinophagaceae bacterium]|nr:MAG: glycosyl hydrolase [Chitinophagaceae bacterium]